MNKFILLILTILFFISQGPAISFKSLAKVKKETKKETKKDSQESSKEEEKKKKEPIIESNYEPILVGALLEEPSKHLNKKIKFRGKFSSFSTLALDYKEAMRKSKDYISLCIFRGDTKIPLSELKLAYPVKDAKEDEVIRELEEGDLVEIFGEVFSDALDEPWVDIASIKNLDAHKKKDKIAEESDKTKDKKLTDTSKKSKKSKTQKEKEQ